MLDILIRQLEIGKNPMSAQTKESEDRFTNPPPPPPKKRNPNSN